MYAMDEAEAFGSWCVKGAGVAEETILKDNPRYRRVSLSGFEDFTVRYEFFIRPMEDLYGLLTVTGYDPRRQRLIQEAIERKRARGHG